MQVFQNSRIAREGVTRIEPLVTQLLLKGNPGNPTARNILLKGNARMLDQNVQCYKSENHLRPIPRNLDGCKMSSSARSVFALLICRGNSVWEVAIVHVITGLLVSRGRLCRHSK